MSNHDKSTTARKDDTEKLRWDLVPFRYLRGMVRVLMFGVNKYAAHNWRKGFMWTRPYNALQRHLEDWLDGEDYDHETGENHLDCALCELLFLRAMAMDRQDLDDRYTGWQEQGWVRYNGRDVPNFAMTEVMLRDGTHLVADEGAPFSDEELNWTGENRVRLYKPAE